MLGPRSRASEGAERAECRVGAHLVRAIAPLSLSDSTTDEPDRDSVTPTMLIGPDTAGRLRQIGEAVELARKAGISWKRIGTEPGITSRPAGRANA